MPSKHSRNNQNNYGGKKSKTRHRRLPAAPNHQGWGWRAPILGIPNPFTIQHPAAAGPTPFHMQPAAGGYIPDTIPRGSQLAALAAGGAVPNHRGWGWQAQDNLGRNIIPDIPNPFTMQSAAAAGPTPFRIRSRRSASAERKSRHNKKHGKKD